MIQRRSGFTLIELLVVIAIIAILAAILFPVFAQAKLAAKKTTALSNAKQIATANFIYMGDYDDALIKEYYGFPSYPACAWGPGPYYGWRWVLAPYHKSKDLLTDQTNPFASQNYWVDTFDANGDGDTLDQYERLSTNFAVNNSIIGFANGRCAGQWTPEGINSLDAVEEPAGTFLMLPNRTGYLDLKMSFIAATGPNAETKPAWCINGSCPADPFGPVHAVGKQTAFIWGDGHAKSKPVLATLRLNDQNNDDWGSKYGINPRTNAAWTFADRQNIAANAWGEYK